ncbi:MAG: helix-turn-helix domain-containing protein [Micromonosporaceae bacterium]
MTRYRNQVRARRALDRIEQGGTSLSRLAADLGFADQAHLTRTVRAHVGCTPTQVRRLLGRVAGRAPEGPAAAPGRPGGSPGQE